MGLSKYTSDECHLCIDSSNRSLKCVPLDNDNINIHWPFYQNERGRSNNITSTRKYEEKLIRLNIKIVNFLPGQQRIYKTSLVIMPLEQQRKQLTLV